MKNSQRIMVKIIKEICSEKGIQCECFSYDWILRLSRAGKTVHIYGYQFENNSASSQLICTDKCATSELLLSRNIPVVEHYFFIKPSDLQYIDSKGNWQGMLDLLDQFHRLVCKPNDGTGGKEVFLVSTPAQLEIASNRIFSLDRSLAISAYHEVEQEFRIILLNNEVKLIYSKTIPALIGDGTSTIKQLIAQQYPSLLNPELLLELNEEKLDEIPEMGKKVPFNWKHNLGQGASPERIDDPDLVEVLQSLAIKAAKTVNVNFASVDIIKTKGEFLVLEINSGIMMESFALSNDQNYQTTKKIYEQAIESLFK